MTKTLRMTKALRMTERGRLPGCLSAVVATAGMELRLCTEAVGRGAAYNAARVRALEQRVGRFASSVVIVEDVLVLVTTAGLFGSG